MPTTRRTGEPVTHNGRPVEFSFWPARRTPAGPVPQTRLFALDPWGVIRQVVEREASANRRTEALACLTQAQTFFEVGTGPGNEAARPLALYYSYLNAAKTFLLTRGPLDTFEGAKHGLALHGRNDLFDFEHALLQPEASSITQGGTPKPMIFHEMKMVMTGRNAAAGPNLEMSALIPQILSGHRLWVEAANADERFFHIQRVDFRHDPAARTMWIELELLADDVGRFGTTRADLLALSQLDDFEEAHSTDPSRLVLQETTPLAYAGADPLGELDSLVERVRHRLWMTVMLVHPYRRYYLYLCPPSERASLLPQLLGMYAVTYFLGSITRYRPDRFDDLLRGAFGPRVRDFITGQPRQFLYQLASEMTRRDVARPSIL